MKTKISIITIAGLVLLATTGKSTAQNIYLNFDSVDASSGPVDATAYLNSYGITLANVTTTDPTGPGYSAVVDIEANNSAGDQYVVPSSPPNFLIELPQSPPGQPYPPDCTFTMDFSTPLSSFTFTRCGDNGTTETPPWSVTAYDGNTEVASAGSPSFDSWTDQSPETYTLTGSEITSITVSAQGYNGGNSPAGISSVPMDNIVLTPVPEPGVVTLFGLLV